MNKKDKIKQDLKNMIEKSNSSQNIRDYIQELKDMLVQYETLFNDIKHNCRIIEIKNTEESIKYLKEFFNMELEYEGIILWKKYLDLLFRYEIDALYDNIKDNDDHRLILDFRVWLKEKKLEISEE